jgi:DNA repair protein RadC
MDLKQALLSGNFADQVNEAVHGVKISESRALFNVLKPLMAEHPDVESFYVLFLTAKNELIKIEKLFSGTISQCSVHTREIVKKIIEHQAASIILAHNHPSGDTTPSKVDLKMTKKIACACAAIDVILLEHLIVGDSSLSMANEGIINKFNEEAEKCFM